MAEESSNHKFTIFGETGSGKTCYLLGMYYQMSSGIANYTITAENRDEARNLKIRYKNLGDKTLGKSRFPDVTDTVQKYNFELQFALQSIMPFEWIDYPGHMIDPMFSEKATPEQLQAVEENIEKSNILFICIDGENLVGNDTKKKISKVREKCVQNINPYLIGFKDKLPPIALIITKYDRCKNDTDETEIKKIVVEAFSLFQRSDVFIAVIPVSIGENIEDDSDSGDLEPVNVHLPILLGVNFALINTLESKFRMMENYSDAIKQAKKIIKKEEDSFFLFRDDQKIKKNEKYIDDYEKHIADIKKDAKFFRNYINRINGELENIDMVFANGVWHDSNGIDKVLEDLQSVVNKF